MKIKYNISGLLKIGQEKHIDQLQKHGLIFCNTVKYFREKEIERFRLRKDTSEGAVSSVNLKSLSLIIHEKEIPLKFDKARLHVFDNKINYNHIYCLYSITPDLANREPFIDKRNIEFGATALLITDPEIFINRVSKSIDGKFKYEFKPVYYYPNNKDYYNITIFNKPQYFAFQHEFRFHFYYNDPNPLTFNIGSIEDISVRIESSKLDKLSLKKDNTS